MSLADFKFIYLWEWSHRQLGRLIGLAFFLPLLWFWWSGAVRGRLALAILSASGRSAGCRRRSAGSWSRPGSNLA